MDLTESTTAADPLSLQAHERWVEPLPDPASDPAGQVSQRDSVRLAFVAALQLLPPRQRAVLILCEVLDWRAAEAAEFLDTTVASVNSALQRARATLAQHDLEELPPAPVVDQRQQALLERYLDAFQRYDMEALTALIHDDATQSMPPFEQWISGRERILEFWQGPGAECRGSRLVPVTGANGRPAFAQYRPSPDGGYHAWSLQVIDLRGERIEEFTMFLDVERLFPRWGLPLLLDAEGVGIS